MTRYLSLEEVVEINAEVTRKFGGLHGIRDHGGLASAVARPQSGYYSDVIEEAAALFESLSQNHPFIDGNKRTAITATAVFLILNDYEIHFDDMEAYEWLMELCRTGRVQKINVESWLREHVRKTDSA